MIVTEAEAAEKWCPFARVLSERSIEFDRTENPAVAVALASYNRISVDLPFAKDHACIGSRCMAWRWVPSTEPTKEYRIEKGISFPVEPAPTEGYCGLGQSYGVARPPSR